jgi:hypothetical protein
MLFKYYVILISAFEWSNVSLYGSWNVYSGKRLNKYRSESKNTRSCPKSTMYKVYYIPGYISIIYMYVLYKLNLRYY